MKKTAVIMAGGIGERFWPKSRKALPKQFLCLTDSEKTMIQLTVERISRLVDCDDIFVVTSSDYYELVHEQLPMVPVSNIIREPFGRNTAPCIGVAAQYIAKKYDDAVMFVLPADHHIIDINEFCLTLDRTSEIAESTDDLVMIGIVPSYPETGYGYINIGDIINEYTYRVSRFVEKPNREKAEFYVKSGEYLWNSGIFTWRVKTIQNCFKKYLPDMAEGLSQISDAVFTEHSEDVIRRCYEAFSPVSIDYGILEKTDNICLVRSSFDWDDVGSWNAVGRLRGLDENGNCIDGEIIALETANCTIQSKPGKLVATIGVSDLIVVDTSDALFICNKDSISKIKDVLSVIKEKGKTEYI